MEYNKTLEQGMVSTVDEVLYGVAHPEEEVVRFTKAARMKPICRIFHNLLFHIVFLRCGGRDNVTNRDLFVSTI